MLLKLSIAAFLTLLVACGGSGRSSAGLPTAAPTAGSSEGSNVEAGLRIVTPRSGAIVDSAVIEVAGVAAAGAEIVHDIPFASDERVAAADGTWVHLVQLEEGANELTFRVGDDESTAQTIHVTYVPATAGVSPDATPEPTPHPTDEPVDPNLAYIAFKAVFWDNASDLYRNDLADLIESGFYWVSSVDKVTYSSAKHQVTFTATVSYESVYAYDHAEWRADTWELFRLYARDFWGAYADGVGDEVAGVKVNWNKWTPGLILSANRDRLRVSCPGKLLEAIRVREASQGDFAKQCNFKYGRR